MLDTAPALRRLLVVDPCEDCHRLMPGLRAAGWDVDSRALDAAKERSCDVGLLRLQPAHLARPDVVKDLVSRSGTEWIVVVNSDVLGLQGVSDLVGEWFFDFHTLPFDVPRVQVTLGRAFGMARLRGQAPGLEMPGREIEQPSMLLGESRPMRELRRLLNKFAPADSPVLIRGEGGTGKELVARTLHRQSARNGKPFVVVNCSAIPENLIAAELFGHEAGAFSGAAQRKVGRIESADGGTLFLDDIDQLPLAVQANLVRFFEERTFERLGSSAAVPADVRVIASSRVDLEGAVRSGRLLEDFYHRLNILQVPTVPLRERNSDMSTLASHFAQFYSSETGRRPRRFSEDALAAMTKYDWPGNVRELANRVRRGLVLAQGRQIEAPDLGLESQSTGKGALMATLEDYKRGAERQALCDVLSRYGDNLSLAARILGVSRPTFYRLLHKHQIRPAR